MTLSADTRLAPHFTAGELTRDGSRLGAFLPVPLAVEVNLWMTAAWLENCRAVLGVPMRITSGYRPPEKNVAVGGSPTSDHLTGLAADFVPVGLSQYRAYTLLKSASLPPWDQIIYYPVQGHMHVGLGDRKRREVRISLSSDAGGTPLLGESLVERLAGYVASASDAAADAADSKTAWAIGIVAVVVFTILLLTRR